MDAKQFIEAHGIAEARKVAEAAGTNYAYFHQMAAGIRRPSVELADKLIAESGNRLTFEKLLRAKKAEEAA